MKTVSHHNVHVLRFNPHAPGQLLSAGRDNIRTHRLHDGALRGVTVRLEVRFALLLCQHQ